MELEKLIAAAHEVVVVSQKGLPRDLRAIARGVAVHFESAPAEDVLEQGFESDILGLFSGDPHGQEASHDNPLPPQITLYVGNLWDFAEGDLHVYREEVRITYLHELGHYFGWDEDEVAARGLD